MSLPRFDVHQHLWPEPFLAALERRTEPPCLRRSRDGLTLVLAGEPEAPFDPAPHDPARYAAGAQRLIRDGYLPPAKPISES